MTSPTEHSLYWIEKTRTCSHNSFEPDLRLTEDQKIKIFLADYLADEARPTSFGYSEFKKQQWRQRGFESLLVQLQMTDGATGMKEFDRLFEKTTMTPDELIGRIGFGDIQSTAMKLLPLLRANQPKESPKGMAWPEHSVGWLSQHPELIAGKDSQLKGVVPDYAKIYDTVVEEAKFGVHTVVGEWTGQAIGPLAAGTFGVFRKLRDLRYLVGRGGSLVSEGPNAWRSASGLRYIGTTPQGSNRVQHVLLHATDNVAYSGSKGWSVFDAGRPGTLRVIDEAWIIAQRGGSNVRTAIEGTTTVFYVNMGRRVGYLGGQVGQTAGRPALNHIRIAVMNQNQVLSAFPSFG